jgi:hypothetical protein
MRGIHELFLYQRYNTYEPGFLSIGLTGPGHGILTYFGVAVSPRPGCDWLKAGPGSNPAITRVLTDHVAVMDSAALLGNSKSPY